MEKRIVSWLFRRIFLRLISDFVVNIKSYSFDGNSIMWRVVRRYFQKAQIQLPFLFHLYNNASLQRSFVSKCWNFCYSVDGVRKYRVSLMMCKRYKKIVNSLGGLSIWMGLLVLQLLSMRMLSILLGWWLDGLMRLTLLCAKFISPSGQRES